MLLQWLLLNFGFRVDKIPREDSSTKIVQSSNFLPVVMDEILRTAARSARTRFFQILTRSSRCFVDEFPRAAAKSARDGSSENSNK